MVEYLKNTDTIIVLLLILLIVVIGCILVLWCLYKYRHLLSKSTASPTKSNISSQTSSIISTHKNSVANSSSPVGTSPGNEYFKQIQDHFQSKKNEFSKLAEDHRNRDDNLFDAKAIQKRIADDKPFHAQIYANHSIAQQAHQQDTGLLQEMHDLDHQLTKKKATLNTLLRFFDEHHQEKKYAYQRQAGKLGSSYDLLKKELKNGTIRENKQEWAQRYCHIFDNWMAKGSPHTIDKLKEIIVKPIKELNEAYPDNEFTPVLSSDIAIADQLHDNIQQLPKEIIQKLQDLSLSYGKVSDLTGQITEKKTPGSKSTEQFAPLNATQNPQLTGPSNSKGAIQLEDKKVYLPTSGNKNQLLKSLKNSATTKLGLPIVVIFLLASAYYGYSNYKEPNQEQNDPDSKSHFLTVNQHHTQLANYLTSLHHQHTEDSTYHNSSRNSIADLSPFYGIDVSHLQDRINWAAVSKNNKKIDFAIIKATEGTNWRDPLFTTNWQAVKAQFPVVGAYHFFNHRDPQQQAANFIEQVPNDTTLKDFFPILDVENDSTLIELAKAGQLINRLQEFIRLVEKHYKRKVIIYSGQNFYQRYLRGYLPGQFFWLAHYCQCDDVQNLIQQSINQPETAEQVVAWQFTDAGQVDGIKGKVDLNYVPAHFWQQIVER